MRPAQAKLIVQAFCANLPKLISPDLSNPRPGLRLLLYIDSIHCGGAQRQLCHLAIGLKALGHDVAVAVYYPQYEYFKPTLRAHNIRLVELRKRGTWGMVRDLARTVSANRISWVISFLEGPSFYALLTKFWCRNFQVCVAERSATTNDRLSHKQRVLRSLYGLADRITTNSEFQANFLRRNYPKLRDRLSTIRNCVGQSFFDASSCDRGAIATNWDAEQDWLAVVGQIAPWKNLHGLIDGLLEHRQRYGTLIKIRWAGRAAEAWSDYVEQQRQRIVDHQLGDRIELIGNVDDVPSFLRSSSGLLHPSTREGFPNAVCEAFAVGLPALIGDISDARILIGNDRGLLFDPHSAESIASALHQFVNLSSVDRWTMGSAAREFASKDLREEVMAIKYAEILSSPN